MKYISIFITVPSIVVANKIINHLLKNNLVSSVNVISNIKSIYWWENKVCKKKEHLLIAQSINNNFQKIVEEVKKLHPYKVPEIVKFNIDANKDFLKWIEKYAKK